MKHRSLSHTTISFLLVIGWAAMGCSRSPQGYRRHSFTTRNMPSAAADVRLPVGLWEKIEAVDPRASEAAAGAKSGSAMDVQTEFMPIKVFLTEKSPGILGGRNHELFFAEGGGEIDLSDFVGSQKGTFFIAFETVVDGNDQSPKVFYLSNAVRRTVGREVLGAGCRGYFEMTSSFTRAMKADGMQVNTTSGRHVSALAGTYFFAIPHGGKLHLAQVTIKDSRFRSLHCRR